MTSINSMNQINNNLGLNMSWKVKQNIDFLQRIASQAKGEEAYKLASDVVRLYKERKIAQSRTAEKVLYQLKREKSKLGIKHAKKLKIRYEEVKPITQRLRAKTNMKIATGQPLRRLRQKTGVEKKKLILGEKIFKLFRNRLKFQVSEETAFEEERKENHSRTYIGWGCPCF